MTVETGTLDRHNQNIKVGTDYASASLENLRMVRGTVRTDNADSDKAKAVIVAGAGFDVKRTKQGEFLIKFIVPFSKLPSATASQLAKATNSDALDNALLNDVNETRMIVYVGGSDGKRYDRSFSFIVMFPK
jgi:hypothetical protein